MYPAGVRQEILQGDFLPLIFSSIDIDLTETRTLLNTNREPYRVTDDLVCLNTNLTKQAIAQVAPNGVSNLFTRQLHRLSDPETRYITYDIGIVAFIPTTRSSAIYFCIGRAYDTATAVRTESL